MAGAGAGSPPARLTPLRAPRDGRDAGARRRAAPGKAGGTPHASLGALGARSWKKCPGFSEGAESGSCWQAQVSCLSSRSTCSRTSVAHVEKSDGVWSKKCGDLLPLLPFQESESPGTELLGHKSHGLVCRTCTHFHIASLSWDTGQPGWQNS